jgi:hypothetical protein
LGKLTSAYHKIRTLPKTFWQTFAKFVRESYNDPVWFLPAGFCVGCILFISSFVAGLPEDITKAKGKLIQKKIAEQEFDHLTTLMKEAEGVLATTGPMLKGLKNREVACNGGEQNKNDYRLYLVVRDQLTESVGKFKGVQFQVPAISKAAKNMEEGVASVKSLLVIMEPLYLYCLEGKKAEAERMRDQHGASGLVTKTIEEALGVQTRSKDFIDKWPLLVDETNLESGEFSRKFKLWLVKLFLVFLAGLYTLYFPYRVLRSIWKLMPATIEPIVLSPPATPTAQIIPIITSSEKK